MVIIVDTLRGFLEPEFPLYCGDHARKIIPNVKQLLKATSETLVWVCDKHSEGDSEFAVFPKHCIANTPGAEIVPELIHFRGHVVEKDTIDGFWGTPLASILLAIKPKCVTVVGVCTDICVLYLVAGLRLRGYEVIVPSNCVASFDQQMHECALKHISEVLGATIL